MWLNSIGIVINICKYILQYFKEWKLSFDNAAPNYIAKSMARRASDLSQKNSRITLWHNRLAIILSISLNWVSFVFYKFETAVVKEHTEDNIKQDSWKIEKPETS